MQSVEFVSKLQQSGRFQVPNELLEDIPSLESGAWFQVEITEKCKDAKDSRKTTIDTSTPLGSFIADRAKEDGNLDNLTVQK